MQEIIAILTKYWFIFLPLSILILITIWLLIRSGYLQEINLFGMKLDFKRDKKGKAIYINNPQKDNPTLSDYNVKFHQTALENVSSLGITQEAVISLVESEFTHHVSYFKWDLLDYPLPVQKGYIVILDKVGNAVTFRAIKQAEYNELELASVNDLLSIYRRLTRFDYRTKKNFIIRAETINIIVNEHKEMIRRLIRHYEIFKGISLPGKEKFPIQLAEYLSESGGINNPQSKDKKSRAFTEKLPSNSKGFAHNITAALSALLDIDKIVIDEQNMLISHDEADKETIVCLERSLQYIHKTINTCLE